MKQQTRASSRVVRHQRLRKKVSGTSERPRLAVFRSLKHISAQIIDDSTGTTLVAASSLEKGLGPTCNASGPQETCRAPA